MSEGRKNPAAKMSLVGHLGELRGRLMSTLIVILLGTLAAFYFREEIFYWFTGPLREIPGQQMQVLGLVEMFVAYLKLSVLAAVFGGAPWILLQTWLFISPGLYGHEKRWIVPFILFGSGSFVGGGLFAFYVVLPLGFEQLVAMVPPDVVANYRVEDYISLVVKLLLAFALIFELPLLMWILAAAGLVSPNNFSNFRKYWMVLAFVLGAFLTPPDPLTQVMMAIPLLLFFEVGLLGARVLYKQSN
jgi:sec-independent protein translocase protein TatC